MKTILVIEDDNDINKLLQEILTQNDYKVISAYSGTEGLLQLEREKVDLIILDLMLPGISGETIINKIKNIPIIVLSAKNDIQNKVDVLRDGANDYITKPFEIQELLVRIEVQFRKQNNFKKEKYEFNNMILDMESYTVTIDDKKIHLTKTEYAILKQLIQNPKKVVPKNLLLDLISIDTPDCVENSLKVHISNIRKKIREVSEEEYIESVWGIGFKMHE